MVELPNNLLPFEKEAASLHAAEIEFAGVTYQILLNGCWVFMQLEGKGQIKDIFCSCEESAEWEEPKPCVHMAAAYQAIYGPHSQPLHQRFNKSLWNHLFQLCSESIGDDRSKLSSLKEGTYEYQSIFMIKGKNKKGIQHLDDIISHKQRETEETSLKFSNLSQEEISLWREGKPSPQLRYQLSFWSDLAKWMLDLQEKKKKYEITFDYSKQKIPNWIHISFDELEAGFHLPEHKLAQLVPSLATVNSPLSVRFGDHQRIASITYDPKKGEMFVEGEEIKPAKPPRKKKGAEEVYLDGWVYIPGEGFYSDEPHALLQNPILQGEELSFVLSEYGSLISGYLADYEVQLEPQPISYRLAFDQNWNLHIESYLFKPGDLKKDDSRLIGDWVFLDHEGFYTVTGMRFHEIETTIPIYQISDFVSQNRSWLNTQEGFQTHVRSVEFQLSYTVANRRLTFERIFAKVKPSTKLQDFGSWIYLEGYGFYPKTMSTYGMQIKPGLSLGPEQIPLFIKMNREELSLIPDFFSADCPIESSSLKVELGPKQTVVVTPQYELFPQYKEKPLELFDDLVYIEDEGFFQIPPEIRLPDKFNHRVELEDKELDLFLSKEVDEIKRYISWLDPRLARLKELILVTNSIQTAKDRGRGWYSFTFFYKTENGLISVFDLWNKMKKKESFAFFDFGMIDLKDKRFEWIRQLKKDRVDARKQAIFITALEFMRLNAYDQIHFLEEGESKEIFEELTQLKTPDEPDIGGLKSHLRPYQEIGVRWLWFLYHQQLSGLLCDDMGLGKTHQAMGLMTSVHNLYESYAQGIRKHFLIVCPTSVIYHWQEKLQEFLPGLKVHTFYGTKRTLEAFQFDILLTSYGILRNEQQMLSKIPFEVAIFDEIQIAKNQASHVYAALMKINAQMKLGLTGTPIENYLRELKSLFDIVLPSYMPGEGEYKEIFVKPIEKEGNPYRKQILNRLIAPFILRRRKKDVLTDLPEKIEEIAHCDLLAHQRQLYSEVLQQRRKHIIDEMEHKGKIVPYMHIFALLSSLKQICDHPAVYLKRAADYKQYVSGKWELFLELLRETRESNQKVVIFSQYLAMLNIIESYLTENGIGFAAIRGATQNRYEQIQKFNEDPNCEVFVGSLQAAGLGIDLTGGSVVIHYDRWWNAARENQATDRVHRIGQTRGVQVFKLVTKNTFEEKIDMMIQRKGQLMEDVIGVDDHTILKKFSREELMDLLAFNVDEEEHPTLSDIE